MDMREVDMEILDELEDGRATVPYLTERMDYSTQYIRDRLGLLRDADHVERIGTGLYELKEDPRDDE